MLLEIRQPFAESHNYSTAAPTIHPQLTATFDELVDCVLREMAQVLEGVQSGYKSPKQWSREPSKSSSGSSEAPESSGLFCHFRACTRRVSCSQLGRTRRVCLLFGVGVGGNALAAPCFVNVRGIYLGPSAAYPPSTCQAPVTERAVILSCQQLPSLQCCLDNIQGRLHDAHGHPTN